MSFSADLRQYVINGTSLEPARQAALTVIQSAIAGQMYPEVLAEAATLPALTFQLISNSTDHTLDAQPCGLEEPRLQIDVWANTGVQREILGQALKDALDGINGTTLVNTEFDVILWDNELNSFEPDRKQYRKMLDFKILHQ